ncbi:MAG TPA: FHA domain-containing protein [Mycobacteriales bacterium]|nr:FHA domain-containing protein [Mycobacteriales bacterium]
MFCTRCGQQNQPDAQFCARCGNPLLRPGDPVADNGPDVSATSTLTLGGLTGPEAGELEPADAERGGEAEGGAAEAAAGLPAGSALLVVRRGPNAGSRFLLDAPVTTAGRHPDSDIFLDDVTVSRRHAEFRREQDGFVVRDVGSLNGTYVNRERIDVAELAGGDEVQVGKFRLVFLLGPAALDQSAPGAGAGS